MQVHRGRNVCSTHVRSAAGIRSTERPLRLSLLLARQGVRPPGPMSIYELPAVPGFGLRNILVLWSESPICICIRIAAARLAILPGAMIDPLRRGAPKCQCILIRLGGSGARAWRCRPSRPQPATQKVSRRPLWRIGFDGWDARMPNSHGVRGGRDRCEFQS